MGKGKKKKKRTNKEKQRKKEKETVRNAISNDLKNTNNSKKIQEGRTSETKDTTDSIKPNNEVAQASDIVTNKVKMREQIERFVNSKLLYASLVIGSIVFWFFILNSYNLGIFNIFILGVLLLINIGLRIKYDVNLKFSLSKRAKSIGFYLKKDCSLISQSKEKNKDKASKKETKETYDFSGVLNLLNSITIGILFYFFSSIILAFISGHIEDETIINLGYLLYIYIVFLILDFFYRIVLKMTRCQFFGWYIVFLIIGWLKAEDIAFFIAIALSLTMSARTYENILSFFEISEFKNERLNQLLESPKELNHENFKYIYKYTKEEWDGKIQYDRIRLSIFLLLAYIVFKYTEQIPLSIEYFITSYSITGSPDTLNLGELMGLYIYKSIDRIMGAVGVFYALLSFKWIKNHLSIGEKERFSIGQIVMGWILVVGLFIPPLVLNAYHNSLFESAVEGSIEAEGIKEGSYSLAFYNRHDFHLRNKRIEVNYRSDKPRVQLAFNGKPLIIELADKTYQRIYCYVDNQAELLERKVVSN